MTYTLYFDIGNSRIKLWRCHGDVVLESMAVPHHGDPGAVLSSLPPSFAGAPLAIKGACVLDEAAKDGFARRCRDKWGSVPEFARSSSHHGGVINAYASCPERLGVDRWLGLLAARRLGKDVCVADCGSAITLDVLRADGRHEGGYILPGLDMMVRVLLQETGRVRFEERVQAGILPGKNTAEAVTHGALASVVALIESLVRDRQLVLILTGGDGPVVGAFLSCPTIFEPELLLHGLQRYFADTGINPD